MTSQLSIIPAFLLTALLALTGCYDHDAFYDPASADELVEQGWDEADELDELDEQDADADADPVEDADQPDEWTSDDPEEPAEVEPEDCAFGEHVSDLAGDHVATGDFDHVFSVADLTGQEVAMLQAGIDAWGWFHAETVDELFDAIDDGRLLVRELELLDGGAHFTHIRFHVHGAEYGHLFTPEGERLAASIEEGWFVGCTVAE